MTSHQKPSREPGLSPSPVKKLLVLLLVLGGLLAVFAWSNASAIRRWRYERTSTNELLTIARQQTADTDLLKETGARLLQDDRAEEARTLLVPAAQAQPHDAELNLLAGRAEWRIGRPEKAATLLLAALQAAPDNPEVCYWTARFLHERGSIRKAEELLLHVTQLDPKRGEAWASLAEIAYDATNYAAALKRADEAEKLTPSAEVAWLRAASLKSLGRPEEAEAAARAAVKRRPIARTYALLGEILQLSPDDAKLREAQSYFHKALQEEPDNITILKSLAINHRSLGEHKQAIKVLRRILRLEPAITEAYMLLSQSYGAVNKPALAATSLRIFRHLEPLQEKVDYARHRTVVEHNSIASQMRYARALIELGQVSAAKGIIERAWFKAPDHPEVKAATNLAQAPRKPIPPLPSDPDADTP